MSNLARFLQGNSQVACSSKPLYQFQSTGYAVMHCTLFWDVTNTEDYDCGE